MRVCECVCPPARTRACMHAHPCWGQRIIKVKFFSSYSFYFFAVGPLTFTCGSPISFLYLANVSMPTTHAQLFI